MPYADLTQDEKAHWNEFATLRQISDWPGFDAAQARRRDASRAWLVDRRKDIWRNAQSKAKGGDGKGWRINNRRERHTFLKDDNLSNAAPKIEVTLPAPKGMTAAERVYIEEREGYLAFASTAPKQKQRKLDNVNWLVKRRKQLYHLMQTDPKNNRAANRQARYDALCIATHTGTAYKKWDATHNKWGKPNKPAESRRAQCVKHARSFIGVNEHPAGSNKGDPHPSDWQKRVIGSDGFAWCACFTTCMAWDSGVQGSATAGVFNNIEMAKSGRGMYRGFTTDHRKVNPGDHVAIGCSSCHIELVARKPTASAVDTVGGNTSPGSSGSQFNGGCVANRTRSRGEVVGYLLVRFPDD